MAGGIYIHVPFCVKKCPYCSFYSLPKTENLIKNYVKKTAELIKTCSVNLKADTIYFGGGTPSVLPPDDLIYLLNLIKDKFGFSVGEVTLEANPSTVDYESLLTLKQGGFNRLSMGFQSGSDEELKILGRLHDKKTAKQAFLDARKAGFENISLDIMLGLYGQTLKQAEKSAEEIINLSPEHISAYMLKIEKGTEFYSRYEDTEEFEDNQGEIYLHICKFMNNHGYKQYEISNFAHSGYESRHNTKYWTLEDYLGIGPSAHSKLGNKRYYMESDLNRYLKGNDVKSLLIYEDEAETLEEYIMMRLRLCDGIDLTEMEKIYPNSSMAFTEKCLKFIKYGYMEKKDSKIWLNSKGFLISNYIISELV